MAKVRNNGARLYILGDKDRTRLMPGRVTECSDAALKCVERGKKQGKPFEVLPEPKKKEEKPEPKKAAPKLKV